MIDLILSQLTDILRIGLIVALVYTMFRTRAETGTVVPLMLGVVFVAVILPMTRGSGAVSLVEAILTGLVANLILLAAVMGLALIIRRFRS